MVAVNYMKNRGDIVEFKAGDVIFHEGDVGDIMYGIVEGEVQLLHKDFVLGTVDAGGVIGETAFVGDKIHQATVVALTDIKLSPIDRRQFLWLVQQTPTFATQVMSTMAERIRTMKELLG